MKLPPLPSREILTDLAKEVGTRERVSPSAVEKDFYLTRTIWALAERFGEKLLLKGGTLLSKVDLGYYRMSEDADLVMPLEGSGRYKSANAKAMNVVRDALRVLAPDIGLSFPHPDGERSDRHREVIWTLPYPSAFGGQAIAIEVSLRPVHRPARRASLRQLLEDPLIGDYAGAYCWAMDATEARAEKVRAAFTREAARDYFDLALLAKAGVDLTSENFLALVDAKLAELKHPSLRSAAAVFGLTPERRRRLEASVRKDLPAVLRIGEPHFDLDAMLTRFANLWRLEPCT